MDSNQGMSSPKHQTGWIWLCVLIVIIAGVIGIVFWYQGYCLTLSPSSDSAANNQGTAMVGGKCTYAEYPGTCKITAVEQVSDQPAGGNEGAKIKFTFTLNKGEEITQAGFTSDPATVHEKILALNGSGDKVGSQACLEEFQIRKNKTYECNLNVITSGTCTPEIYLLNSLENRCLMY